MEKDEGRKIKYREMHIHVFHAEASALSLNPIWLGVGLLRKLGQLARILQSRENMDPESWKSIMWYLYIESSYSDTSFY
jgi:hypothetical protein